MEDILLNKNLIPLDKSWIIRMGFLDLMNGYKDIHNFLKNQKNLNDDLVALKNICKAWDIKTEIHVGESGTLYRYFKFASWKLGLNKKFILEKTLKGRNICDSSSIISLPIEKLLTLDNGTSQWASVAVLMGNNEKVEKPPFKLKVTYDAISHWREKRKNGEIWEPRYDQTILNQAITFIKMFNVEKTEFIPEQAEDYCFARIFDFISKEEGEKIWPALKGHESNRIKEMEIVIDQIKNNKKIISKDHRVVQAVGLYQKLHRIPSTVIYPGSVNKSWPQFWDFVGKVDIIHI